MTQLDARPGSRPRRNAHLSDYAALSAEIKEAGLLRRSYGYYGAYAGALLLGLVGLVAGSVLLGDSWWQVALAPLYAILLAQFGFLGHEAAHRQIFASGKNNDRAALAVANLFVGMSISWWKNKHTKHHGAPNKVGVDPDISPGPLSYTAEVTASRSTSLTRWLTRRQGYYFFGLVFLTGLSLQVESIKYLSRRSSSVKGRPLEIGLLAARHLALIVFAFALMSPLTALAFLLVMQLLFGFYLGMSFAPNHIGRPIVAQSQTIDFLRRQVVMSRNIAGGPALDVAMGGLNLQIEHHLFPSMSRPNLRRAAPIIREHCARLGIDFPETSVPQAYQEVAAYLQDVGVGEVDLWQCPLAAAMGRA